MDSKALSSLAVQRGVRSFYADLVADPLAVRICTGLSCQLAGARCPDEPAGGPPVRAVQCLGYCDRSPARLMPDGRVALTDGSGPVSIRCIAPQPVVTARIGKGDFSDLAHARDAGVYLALAKALAQQPVAVLEAVEASGEQGRGGAGFPTGRKWRLAAEAAGSKRYVVANGDEGDPGSFIDRLLLEYDPHAILEGMALCAWAIGASEGVVYIRSEYPAAQSRMEAAIAQARSAGFLGTAICNSSFSFEVRVVTGHGSYVCGEETALLNAIEGRRGEVRVRPPYPAVYGLHGQPTVVNNIETLVNIPWIVARGAEAFRKLGTPDSPGTKAFCFNHGFARPGVVEAEFGLSLRELVETHGGGSHDGQPLAGIVLGGPMGSILLPEEWDVRMDYRDLAERGIHSGHGGLVALPAGTDWRELMIHWLEFMVAESCGKCVPCRLGSTQALALARQADAGEVQQKLPALLDLIATTSLCGFGQSLPRPVERLRALAQAAGAKR
ncbi:MAG: NADH-ubiquinone oxidoreductase-F iron-sulfur binding region domain-containing protein [Gammaproteobacteria bacterium]